MDTVWIVVVAVLAALVVVGIGVWLIRSRRNRDDVRTRFGPEYDRTVERLGDEDAARRDLEDRVERRRRFDIRELDDAERQRFTAEWEEIQRRFVDEPDRAVEWADVLIQDAMRARGYPLEDFEQRARDLSVDHPEVVEHYRAGRGALEHGERIPTERHREAMLHFRALFERLVGTSVHPDRPDDRRREDAT